MFHISTFNRNGKRSKSLKCKIKKIDKKLNYARKLIRGNSPFSDHKNMKHILAESSLRDASNGGIYMRLGSIDEEIIRKV